jgi:hypothetical protein
MTVKKWIIIVILCVGIAACNQSPDITDQPVVAAGHSQTWIDAPLPNSIIPMHPYKIMFHSTSPVEITEFYIDIYPGTDPHNFFIPVSNVVNGTLFYGEYIWTPPAPGRYNIFVASNWDKDPLYSQTMIDITVIGYEDQVVTPSPTDNIEEVEGCNYTALVNLNCRLGPGSDYISVGFFLPGQSAPVVGKTTDDVYWYVVAPDTGNVCTVPNSSDFGTVEGDCSASPIFTPVPLPTLTPTLTLTPTPESACLVENMSTGEFICTSPCPAGAVPGDPCELP